MGGGVSRRDPKLPRGIDSPKPGTYRVRMSLDGVQYVIGTYDTLTDARAALAIARGDKARGLFIPPAEARRERRAERERVALETMALRDWCARWLAELEQQDRRPATIATYRSVMHSHVLPELGDVYLRNLTPDEIADWVAALRKRPATRYKGASSNGVAINAARTLRSCLNAAVRAGVLDASPFRTTIPKPPRVRPGDDRDDVATPAEVAAIRAAMPEQWRVAIDLAAWCQLRLGEVLGLQRHDFENLADPHRAVLHVRRQLNSKTSPPSLTEPKTAAGRRTIAIPPNMLPALVEHLRKHAGPGASGFVLTSPEDAHSYLSQSTFDKAYRAARGAAGRPFRRFHDLRHTGLTLFAQQGATAAELMHRGGHRSLAVAMRYQHATAERDRDLAAKMGAALLLEMPTG